MARTRQPRRVADACRLAPGRLCLEDLGHLIVIAVDGDYLIPTVRLKNLWLLFAMDRAASRDPVFGPHTSTARNRKCCTLLTGDFLWLRRP
jgi:hypothetical protein